MTGVIVIAVGASLEPSHEALLADWARARGVRLEVAREDPPAKGYDTVVVARIEVLLEEARVAAGALDDPAAFERLEQAERLLREHPELPQAGWLMADRHAIEALLRERHADQATLAARSRARAHSLEGARAEVLPADTAGAGKAPQLEQSARTIRIARPAPVDQVEIDGALVGSSAVLVPGEHHARILRGDSLLWAGFVELAEGADALSLPRPEVAACSRAELLTVRLAGDRLIVPAEVRCPRWAAVLPLSAGRIEIAPCQRATCGPLAAWPEQAPAAPERRPAAAAPPGWPAWATWVAIGAGVLVATGVVVWQSGAFDEPERGSSSWVFGGVKEAGFRF